MSKEYSDPFLGLLSREVDMAFESCPRTLKDDSELDASRYVMAWRGSVSLEEEVRRLQGEVEKLRDEQAELSKSLGLLFVTGLVLLLALLIAVDLHLKGLI